MIFVVDADGAWRALRGGLLACPDCGGGLGPWCRARRRRLVSLTGPVEITPERGRCRSCRRTHVLLPAGMVPRRGYTADVIGSVLLAGAGLPTSAGVDVPAGTTRRWLDAARRSARGLLVQAGTVAAAFGGTIIPAGAGRRHGSPLADALDALGEAARDFTLAMPVVPVSAVTAPTGIDYLGLLMAEHRRALARRLRLADPERAGTLTPWAAVAVITGGRLLTTVPDG